MAARIPMIETTMSNSINVKPACRLSNRLCATRAIDVPLS
jgi:hypothetical protein